jgi:uncharacterized protein YndB with AHSA1/START domain
MVTTSRHVSVSIDRPPDAVYRFVREPANLPAWAKGLGGSIANVGGEWVAESPMGKVRIRFAPPNAFGVLDHEVVLESGATFLNPMRVVANGSGSEVVFTLFRQAGMTEGQLEADAAAVEADLRALKRLLER